jgi:hypothetical protein
MKRIVTQIIVTGVLSIGIFVPQVLFAQGGLVPCGQEKACTLCDGFILFQNIYTFLLGLVASIGVLAFVAGGLIIMTARADPQQVQRGKSVLVNSVIGIIIVLGSFLILNALVFILVSGSDEFSPPSGAFTIISGQGLTIENCDTADRFKDRGGGTDVSSGPEGGGTAGPGGGGDGGSVDCSEGDCANNENIVQAAENNAYNVDSDLLISIVQAGEGCNNEVRSTCYEKGWNDIDCSCGYSQCNTDNRKAFLGSDVSPQESCRILRNNVQKDLDCAARVLAQGCDLSNVRSASSCYNAGPGSPCSETTNNYCQRVENYYNQCTP